MIYICILFKTIKYKTALIIGQFNNSCFKINAFEDENNLNKAQQSNSTNMTSSLKNRITKINLKIIFCY